MPRPVRLGLIRLGILGVSLAILCVLAPLGAAHRAAAWVAGIIGAVAIRTALFALRISLRLEKARREASKPPADRPRVADPGAVV